MHKKTGSAEANKVMFSATDGFKWLKLGNTKINKEKEGFFPTEK